MDDGSGRLGLLRCRPRRLSEAGAEVFAHRVQAVGAAEQLEQAVAAASRGVGIAAQGHQGVVAFAQQDFHAHQPRAQLVAGGEVLLGSRHVQRGRQQLRVVGQRFQRVTAEGVVLVSQLGHALLVAGAEGDEAGQLLLQRGQGLIDGADLVGGEGQGDEVLHERSPGGIA